MNTSYVDLRLIWILFIYMLHIDGKSQSKFPFKDNKVLFYITVFYIYWVISYSFTIITNIIFSIPAQCLAEPPLGADILTSFFPFVISSSSTIKKIKNKSEETGFIYLTYIYIYVWCLPFMKNDHALDMVWACTTCGVTMHHTWCDHAPQVVWPCTTYHVGIVNWKNKPVL